MVSASLVINSLSIVGEAYSLAPSLLSLSSDFFRADLRYWVGCRSERGALYTPTDLAGVRSCEEGTSHQNSFSFFFWVCKWHACAPHAVCSPTFPVLLLWRCTVQQLEGYVVAGLRGRCFSSSFSSFLCARACEWTLSLSAVCCSCSPFARSGLMPATLP